MSEIPAVTDFDITAGTTSAAVRTVLDAKYTDAGNWAQWAASVMTDTNINIDENLSSDASLAALDALVIALDALPDFTPGTIVVGTDDFTNTLLVALQSRLAADIATYSTGLGTAETGLFARETARQNAARSAAYTELTTQQSARGFDLPPGALTAKQTEVNNETALKLADSSSAIMAESARLAVGYNKDMLAMAVQLEDMLSRVFDSHEMRLFEASKAEVLNAADAFKTTMLRYSTKGELELKKADLITQTQARHVALTVSTLQGRAQAMAQMVSGALNGVGVTASLGHSATTSTGQRVDYSTSNSYHQPEGTQPAYRPVPG